MPTNAVPTVAGAADLWPPGILIAPNSLTDPALLTYPYTSSNLGSTPTQAQIIDANERAQQWILNVMLVNHLQSNTSGVLYLEIIGWRLVIVN